MSEEKQIEEMARVIAEVQYLGGLEQKVAQLLFERGCRKQSEGRWTYGVDRGDTMKCTLCRRRMPKFDNARYCPNCGAKMKGGEG